MPMEPSQALLSYYETLQQSEALPLSLRSTVRHLPFSLTHVWPRIPQDGVFAANLVQSLNHHIQSLVAPSGTYGLELICAGQQHALPLQHSSILFYDGQRGLWDSYPAEGFRLWAAITLYDEQEWQGLEDIAPEFPALEDISHLIRWQQQLQQMIARAQAESFESLDAQIALVGLLSAASRLGGSLLICQQKLPSKDEERVIALDAVRHDALDLHKRVLQAVGRNDLSADMRQKLWRSVKSMPMTVANKAVPQLASAALPKQRITPQAAAQLASAQKTASVKPDTPRASQQKTGIQDRRPLPASPHHKTAASPIPRAVAPPERPTQPVSEKIVTRPRIVERNDITAGQKIRLAPAVRTEISGNRPSEIARVSSPTTKTAHEKTSWPKSSPVSRTVKPVERPQTLGNPAVQENIRPVRNAEVKVEKVLFLREASATASDRKPPQVTTSQKGQGQQPSPLPTPPLVVGKVSPAAIPAVVSPAPEMARPTAMPVQSVTISNTEPKASALFSQTGPAASSMPPIAETRQAPPVIQNEMARPTHPPVSLDDLWKASSTTTAEPTTSLQEQLEAASTKNPSDATCGASCGGPVSAEQQAPTRLMSMIAQQAFQSGSEPQKSAHPSRVKKLTLS